MHAIGAPRLYHWLARWALALFVLAQAVAVASPLLKPEAKTLLCTATGELRMVSLGGDADPSKGGIAASHASLDCVLCLGLDVAVPPVRLTLSTPAPFTVQPSLPVWQWVPQHVHPARPGQGPPISS